MAPEAVPALASSFTAARQLLQDEEFGYYGGYGEEEGGGGYGGYGMSAARSVLELEEEAVAAPARAGSSSGPEAPVGKCYCRYDVQYQHWAMAEDVCKQALYAKCQVRRRAWRRLRGAVASSQRLSYGCSICN